jgi:hypothetical protein
MIDTGESPENWQRSIGCTLRFAELTTSDQQRAILDALEEDASCRKGYSYGYVSVTAHRAAALLGEWDQADEIEASFAEEIKGDDMKSMMMDRSDAEGTLAHIQGVRSALQGDLEGAIEKFAAADEKLTYIQAGIGLFKLYNRLFLVEALFAAGDEGKAHLLLSKVRSVNPALVDDFEEQGLRILGLER